MSTFMDHNGHAKGDKECDGCSCALNAPATFPEPHECGGLLHANDAEEEDGAHIDGVVALYCDGCGATGTCNMPGASAYGASPAEPATGRAEKRY